MKGRNILWLTVCAAALTACARPKIISDDELTLIFKEIYLTNAYTGQTSINTDSLDIYAPILREHGFRPRDLNYTLNNFSKRKSARITDIIDGAVAQIEEELAYFTRRVALLDSIDRIAAERYKTLALFEPQIKVTRIADTSRLRIVLPANPGTYEIRYGYLIDSLDKNTSLRTTHTLRDSAGRQVATNTHWMRAFAPQHHETKLVATPAARTLEIRFANYPKDLKTPNLRIDSLTVTHFLPQEQAMDLLHRSLFKYIFDIDGMESPPYLAPDSGTLFIHPPWLPEERRTDD